MNPALPVLLGLSLAGWLLLRRTGAARALLLCGLAGLGLLGGALLWADGIPSPAADLQRVAPWGAHAAPGGNPAVQDVTFQIHPWLLHLRHEVRAGRWPFWNPHQFSGMTFWGNGQSAPLAPFHLLFVILPLQLAFWILPWARIVAGGLGAYALSRELGLSAAAASVAAVSFPLSGMLVSFLLFPMANALALVPWVFWAVERIANGRGGSAALGLAVGLQLLGGHPETGLHTALLTALYLAWRAPLRAQRLSVWTRFAAGWTAGGLVAAVVLWPLAATVLDSARWQQGAQLRGAEPALSTLLALPMRLVLPDLYGNPARGTWWGPFNYLATAVYAGALALPLAALGIAGCFSDRRRLAWAGLLLFSAAAAWHAPGLTQLLGALPLLGDALQHRLLVGVELALAILAGFGVERWLAGGGRAALWGMAVGLALLASAAALYVAEWSGRGLLGGELRWAGWVLVVWLGLWLSLRLLPAQRARFAVVLTLIAALDLVAAHRRFNPGLPLRDLYAETGAVEFLRGKPGRVAATGAALRPNAAMVYGLDDIRGDDSLKPRPYEDILSELGTHHPAFFTPIERWQSPWLDRLGLRWVLTPPGAAPADPSWRLAYDGRDARIFERTLAPPLVRWAAGAAPPAEVEKGPGRWRIAIPSGDHGELVVAEGWDGGWRAELDGRRVPLRRVETHLIGVRVEPGSRELILRYRPRGLVGGAWLSALGVAWIGLAWSRGW